MYSVGVIVKWCNHYGKQYGGSSKKKWIPKWSSNLTSGYIPKRIESRVWRDICVPMFRAALFTILKRWKQPKCPFTDEWINKMGCIHTMEYYSALKRRENLSHTTVWGYALRTFCQVKWAGHGETNTAWFHVYERSKLVKSIETESRMVVSKD